MSDPHWGVWYEASGGISGYRSGWVKADGRVRIFSSEEEARREAERLSARANDSPRRRAEFMYAPQPLALIL